jgi:hypothetical protein
MSKGIISFTQTLRANPKRIVFNKAWLFPMSLVTAMLFSWGCNEVPGDTGLAVLPEGDRLNMVYTETSDLEFESQVLDKVRTGGESLQLLGNYYDPAFGRINAQVFTQVLIPGADLDFGQDLSFISLKLNLKLFSVYGRFDSPMKLGVYELAENLPEEDSSLISTRNDLQTTGQNLAGDFVIDFSEASSFSDLSISLDRSLGEKILFADSSALVDNASFTDFFKGLAIKTENAAFFSREPGAIFSIFLNSSETFLRLTYRYTNSEGVRETDSLDFAISEDARKFHTLQREAVKDLVLDTYALSSAPPADGQQYEFIQAGTLIRNYIGTPSLDTLPLVGINRAELLLPVDGAFLGSAGRFSPPDRIFVFLADENRDFLYDELGRKTLFTSSTYNPQERTYRINMTAQAQLVVSGRRENNGFILVADDSAVSVNRAVFGGLDHPTLKPKFKLTYSTLPRQ